MMRLLTSKRTASGRSSCDEEMAAHRRSNSRARLTCFPHEGAVFGAPVASARRCRAGGWLGVRSEATAVVVRHLPAAGSHRGRRGRPSCPKRSAMLLPPSAELTRPLTAPLLRPQCHLKLGGCKTTHACTVEAIQAILTGQRTL